MTMIAAKSGAQPQIIDVHHHYMPPFYLAHATPWLKTNASAIPRIMQWTPASSIASLDEAGVRTALLSISSPGFAFEDGSDARAIARQCNLYAAKMASDFSGRFQVLTALPLPDIDVALEEIAYGYDVLKVTGVGLLTSYAGRYLGDPVFAPILDELDRRRAVVHVHPTDAPCCRGLVPGIPTPMLEYGMDTARTIGSLLWSGTLGRCPNIKSIFSHGGGALPMLLQRLVLAVKFNPALAQFVPEDPMVLLSKLYVDTASVTNPIAFAAVSAWLGPDRILFGSDFPWGTLQESVMPFKALALPESVAAKILSANAQALIGTSGEQIASAG